MEATRGVGHRSTAHFLQNARDISTSILPSTMRKVTAAAFVLATTVSQLQLAWAFTSSPGAETHRTSVARPQDTLQSAYQACLPSPRAREYRAGWGALKDTRLSSSASDEASESAEELFASAGWPAIKKDLDELPVFTVASDKGQPLQYSVGGSAMPFFFVDLDAAREELLKAKADSNISDMEGMEGIDVIPFPLGDAFMMMETGKAVVVPSQKAIEDAGAPKDVSPVGQQVPLFSCMAITQEGRDGKPLLPLFFVKQEVQDAIDEALEIDGDDGDNKEEFVVTVLSLQRAVQLLATVPESPAFNFLPPQKSIKHIKEYLEG